ncbi:MAG: TonB-dependent receptor [Bacteroidetes bacterium]|nr:MAG: TonB-dependent receptor [Bacteroidota bacterium]
MRLFITLILSIISFTIFAQGAVIKVVDKRTKEALPFVNVCFESLNSKQKQYAITGSNGTVINPCKDTCIIAISFVGYKTQEDTIAAHISKTYFLENDVFNLDQVVVTATRSRKTLKDAPVITQVITSKDISNRGITNVQDVLAQDIPGLEFQRGGFGSDIKMQGLEAKNILILVDGERMAGESGGNVDYSRLNADNVERIEIVKGAASALYGSQAMGGVINIITKKTKKKWEVNIGGRWAQINEVNYPDLSIDDEKYLSKKNLDLQNLNLNASLGFNLKWISGRTDFAAKNFDGYLLRDKVGIDKEFINIDTTIYDAMNPFPTGINGYKDYSIQQKLNIPIGKRINVELKGSYYNHDEYDFVPDNVYQNFEDYSYGAKFNYEISDKYHLIASYHYDNYQKFDYFEKLDEKEVNYRNIFINPKLIGSAKVGKHQEFTGGMEYLSESLMTGLFAGPEPSEKENTTSILFIQDDINIHKNWNFILGGRMDYHTAFGAHFSPKVSGMYKKKAWAFRANYAKGFRSPTLKELYMDWPIAWFTIKGDENLKPETNNYFSGSVEFTKGFINTSVTAYYNKLQNKIDGVWKNGQTVYQYVNVSESELSGLEFSAQMFILKHFVVSGAYSYLHDKRPQGELVSSASPHSGNIKFAYNIYRKKYRLNVNISGNIIGAKDYQVSETIKYKGQDVEGIYPVHFDAYSIWRIAISQYFFNGINLTLGIDNIFDFTADVVSFNTSTSPGRRAFISMNIKIDQLVKKK